MFDKAVKIVYHYINSNGAIRTAHVLHADGDPGAE